MKRLFVILLLLSSAVTLASQTLEAERLPDLNIPRAGHNVFYVGGELTVVGGHTSGFVMTPTAEYFSDGAWHLVPTMTEFGSIKYNRPAIADKKAKRAYLLGNDSTNRVYVVAVEYDKRPAPHQIGNRHRRAYGSHHPADGDTTGLS